MVCLALLLFETIYLIRKSFNFFFVLCVLYSNRSDPYARISGRFEAAEVQDIRDSEYISEYSGMGSNKSVTSQLSQLAHFREMEKQKREDELNRNLEKNQDSRQSVRRLDY